MSRSLQINDFVNVSLPGSDVYRFVITDIKSDSIYIDNPKITNSKFKLVQSNNKWRIDGNNVDYDIRFIANDQTISSNSSQSVSKTFLTNIPEVDFDILLKLDNQSLNSVCQVNDYAKSLCDDKYFWKLKLEKEYPNFLIPDNIKSYRKVYFLIYDAFLDPTNRRAKKPNVEHLIKWASKKGHVDILDWIFNDLLNLDLSSVEKGTLNNYVTLIVKKGKLNVIEWLLDNHDISDNSIIDYAIESNRSDILDLMKLQNRINPPYNFVTSFRKAARKGYLDIFKKIYEITGILPDTYGNTADFAFVYNKKDTLEWLESHGIKFSPKKSAKLAADKGKLEALKKLSEMGYEPDKDIMERAAKGNHLDILEWLFSKGIFPTTSMLKLADRKGYIEMTKWIETIFNRMEKTGYDIYK